MRTRSILTVASAGLLAATGLVATVAGPTAASPGGGPIAAKAVLTNVDFLQFNVAGATRNNGDLVVSRKVDELVEIRNPNIITLNELCRNQYSKLKELLPSYDSMWATTLLEAENCNNGEYGIAVFSENAMTDQFERQLPDDPGNPEGRKLLCGKTDFHSRVVAACVTHLHPKSEYWRNLQIQKSLYFINDEYNANRPIVFGGDFNLNPNDNDLDRVYSSGNGGDAFGRYDEVDQGHGCSSGDPKCRGGVDTHDTEGKVDYIFITDCDFKSIEGSTFSSPVKADDKALSDHRVLVGWAENDNC